jgi:hypothetical protein
MSTDRIVNDDIIEGEDITGESGEPFPDID